jgi:hypothetical protein
MLDFSKYQSIGAELKDALDEFANEVCLIQSDRDREKGFSMLHASSPWCKFGFVSRKC